MREAVIVSSARTAIGKAYRGAFNDTPVPTLASFSMKEAIARAQLNGNEIDDVILGSALTQGSAGVNLARHAVFAAGLSTSIAGATIDRQCASGLNAIAIGTNQINAGDATIILAGGVESISLVQNKHWNAHRYQDPNVVETYYLPMIETAKIVANKYGINREMQDLYSLQSQERTHLAQADGIYIDEIVSVTVNKIVQNKESGEIHKEEVTINTDECNRPGTTLENLASLKPVLGKGTHITAGNASQLSDGSAALIIMEASEATRRNIEPLGALRGFVVAGCAPDEMGIGPVVAIPKLLKQHRLEIDDIGVWEINEAFASQLVYCRNKLGIPNERLNVNGGAIAIGHPYGTSGARMAGHILREGHRRKIKYGVVSMCVGGGQGAAGLFEIY